MKNFFGKFLKICVKTQEKMSYISERVKGKDIGQCKRDNRVVSKRRTVNFVYEGGGGQL